MGYRETAARGHLLVIVPQEHLRESLTDHLSAAGHEVTAVATGAEAMARIENGDVDLIVVDVDIPDLYDLADRRPVLADRPPIICMTTCEALGSLLPEVGTEVEDYVTKPCRVPELLARVQVQLRQPVLRHADLILDEVTYQAWRSERALGVTAAEYRLLRHLLLHAGQVFSKDQLAHSVWGESRDMNTIERLISRLRQKVDAVGPALIHTKRGFGYWLG